MSDETLGAEIERVANCRKQLQDLDWQSQIPGCPFFRKRLIKEIQHQIEADSVYIEILESYLNSRLRSSRMR